MKTASEPGKKRFVQTYILPALVIFLIPGFGYWFFDHVEKYYDREVRESLLSQIRADHDLTPARREKLLGSYSKFSAARLLASSKPELKSFQANFKRVSFRYAIFRWMKRIGLACLLAGAATLVLVGVGVVFSFRSQQMQYWSLWYGFNLLRWVALVEVVGQGILAVALSYWVTAFWLERYFVKLIAVAAILALCAVALLIKAIFRKVVLESEFEGFRLTRESAPELWDRITTMAGKMGIMPPDHIFVGIDDNFFVTEQPVKVGGEHYKGRTLFASISMLKMLSRSEADAVLGHELAHFSGEDTYYSTRVSPLLGKYFHYLAALRQGGLSLPVFYFMFFFWNLYQLSLNKLRREREFRADGIGRDATSAEAMGQALVKISAYCRYRNKIQASLFEKDENVEAMDVFQRIATGFPEFMRACAKGSELAESRTAHPFDSHPPLEKRLKHLGLDDVKILQTEHPLPEAANSWFSTIAGAQEIEARQWKEFEDRFHKAHQERLAWHFRPDGQKEIEHVVKYFPEAQWRNDKGITATVDYEKIFLSDWPAPVMYSTIKSCKLEDAITGKQLTIEFLTAEGKKQNRKFKPEKFKTADSALMNVFQKYYSRYLTAKKHHEMKAVAGNG